MTASVQENKSKHTRNLFFGLIYTKRKVFRFGIHHMQCDSHCVHYTPVDAGLMTNSEDIS